MEKKHLTRFFMLAVAAGTLFGACQKEDIAAVEDDFDMTGRIPLYAEKLSNSSGAKLVATETTAAHEFSWADNDQIRYSGGTITVTHNSIAESDLPTINAENPFIAVYPADACNENTFATNGKVTITIPHEIEYAGDGVVKMTMIAYTTNIDEGISFKHLAAVLAVKVKNSNTSTINMNKITVSMRTKSTEAGAQELAIAGKWEVPYTVSEEGGITINPNNTAININQDGTNDYKGSITMTFDATPCSIESNGTKYFFFPVRTNPANVGHFTIKVEAIDANENACNFEKTQASKSQAIGRGEIAYAPVALDASTNTHAFFLVDGYYEIATGNLAYNITNRKWDFLPYNVATVEDDSWTDEGDGEHHGVDFYNDDKHWMSCFLYGYAEHPTYLGYNNQAGTVRDIPSAGLSGVTDWGYQAKDDIGEGWTTPTSAQWEALLGQGNAKHWAEVTSGFLSDVNIDGYIVVPDVITFYNNLKYPNNTTYLSRGNLTQEVLTLSLALSDLQETYRTYEFIYDYGAIFIPKGVACITGSPDDDANLFNEGNPVYNASDHCHYNVLTRQKDEQFFESSDWVASAPVRLIRKVNN